MISLIELCCIKAVLDRLRSERYFSLCINLVNIVLHLSGLSNMDGRDGGDASPHPRAVPRCQWKDISVDFGPGNLSRPTSIPHKPPTKLRIVGYHFQNCHNRIMHLAIMAKNIGVSYVYGFDKQKPRTCDEKNL